MRDVHHDHVLQVSDLVSHPGASRQVHLTVPAPEELDLPLVRLRGPLDLDGVVESVVDGLLVRADLRGELALECARCLAPIDGALRTEVVELFVDPARVPADAEPVESGYEISDGRIDLDALLRDSVTPATPSRPLCRPDCAGLCASCGANLNEARCACDEVEGDPRWAALADLRLPADPEHP